MISIGNRVLLPNRIALNSKTRFWGFLYIWTLGGVWVFITMAAGLAAITSMTQRPLGIFAVTGLLLWLSGFMIEVVADRQKIKFRQLPENSNHFITTGLWAYSRHPNYCYCIAYICWLAIRNPHLTHFCCSIAHQGQWSTFIGKRW